MSRAKRILQMHEGYANLAGELANLGASPVGGAVALGVGGAAALKYALKRHKLKKSGALDVRKGTKAAIKAGKGSFKGAERKRFIADLKVKGKHAESKKLLQHDLKKSKQKADKKAKA